MLMHLLSCLLFALVSGLFSAPVLVGVVQAPLTKNEDRFQRWVQQYQPSPTQMVFLWLALSGVIFLIVFSLGSPRP